eukprot:SAG11_NODE_31740_length_289_cov_1.231579_1_plen_64_part_10
MRPLAGAFFAELSVRSTVTAAAAAFDLAADGFAAFLVAVRGFAAAGVEAIFAVLLAGFLAAGFG